jgi:phage terminase large subunit-like protein
MATPGTAFWRNAHVWVIITDPVPTSGDVVCVNLTTFDTYCADDECVLTDKDFAWIKPNHPTAVAFSYARAWKIEKIVAEIQRGTLKLSQPPAVPAGTLEKIRNAATTSARLSNYMKALL